MLVQVRGPKGERGWIVDARMLLLEHGGIECMFVEGDADALRKQTRYADPLPVYVELNLTAIGFRQVRGQVVWRQR